MAGCATQEAVEHAQATADQALSAANAAGQKADQAQATAQSAMSAAQAAQTTANQALHSLVAKKQITMEQAAIADDVCSVLMGDNVESRRHFIQTNAKDVRFLDI